MASRLNSSSAGLPAATLSAPMSAKISHTTWSRALTFTPVENARKNSAVGAAAFSGRRLSNWSISSVTAVTFCSYKSSRPVRRVKSVMART